MKHKFKNFLAKISPLLLYFLVGGCASIVEWLCFFLLHIILCLHYQIATIIAIVFSTFSNWGFGRLFLFKRKENVGLIVEIGKIYLASIVGLVFNMVLMWLFIDKFMLNEMISKIIATGVVFVYNYLIRRLYIYKKD